LQTENQPYQTGQQPTVLARSKNHDRLTVLPARIKIITSVVKHEAVVDINIRFEK